MAPEHTENAAWPMYRQNPRRLATSAGTLPARLEARWKVEAGTSITPPVCAEGILITADKDANRVLALDPENGARKWSFLTTGSIDSTPTIYRGRVLFGSADGRVYCLDADDGALVWRFQAAPVERLICDEGRLASAWPVHGSVLVEDGIAYVTAGRNTWLDGGIHAYALDPATGKALHYRLLKDEALADGYDPGQGPGYNHSGHVEGARSDLLVSDGKLLYLGPIALNKHLEIVALPYFDTEPKNYKPLTLKGAPFVEPKCFSIRSEEYVRSKFSRQSGVCYGEKKAGLHLASTGGLLSSRQFPRFYWSYAKIWPGCNHGNLGPKCGQILCVDDTTTYSLKVFNARDYRAGAGDPHVSGKGQLLSADANDNEPVILDTARGARSGQGYTRTAPPKWHHWLKMNVRALAAGSEHLFVAGPSLEQRYSNPFDPYYGNAGSKLLSFSKQTGEKVAETELGEQPVFDGMAIANGCLYLSTLDGNVICLQDAAQ
jgi:outer membrane protein assembly factor BamB